MKLHIPSSEDMGVSLYLFISTYIVPAVVFMYTAGRITGEVYFTLISYIKRTCTTTLLLNLLSAPLKLSLRPIAR
jgi:hypothetical protein